MTKIIDAPPSLKMEPVIHVCKSYIHSKKEDFHIFIRFNTGFPALSSLYHPMFGSNFEIFISLRRYFSDSKNNSDFAMMRYMGIL